MACINKSLKEYKDLEKRYGDTIAESIVRAISKNRNLKDNFYIPSIAEAKKFLKYSNDSKLQRIRKGLTDNPYLSLKGIKDHLQGVITVLDGVHYIVKGTNWNITDNFISHTEIFEPNHNIMKILKKEYPKIFNLKYKDKKDVVAVEITPLTNKINKSSTPSVTKAIVSKQLELFFPISNAENTNSKIPLLYTLSNTTVQKVNINFNLNEEILKPLRELHSLNKPTNIVGGAVRDGLEGRTPKDIDFEVYNITKENLIQLLQKYGEVDERGVAFGVIVLQTPNGDEYEFAIPRKDNKTGTGYTGFTVELSPNMSFKEASKRRDFTWNSISYNPLTNVLYDPNNGISDLQEGIIRHIDDKTFSEDPLRILRAMQFQSRMGHSIAPNTLKLMKQIVKNGELSSLSQSRFISEWRKWAIKGENPDLLFDFLRDSGLEEFFPEFNKLKDTEQDSKWHPEGDVEIHTKQVLQQAVKIAKKENLDEKEKEILIFAALLHDIAKPETTQKTWNDKLNRFSISAKGHEAAGVEPSRKFLLKIGMDKGTIDIILALVREHLAHASISAISDIKGKKSAFAKLINRLQPASIPQLVRLMEADMLGRNPEPESADLILPIGISGSGKSTWINTLSNVEVVSPDDIRREITGSISDQSKNKEVFDEVNKRIDEALKYNQKVVVDATNLNTIFRKEFIKKIKRKFPNKKIAYKLFKANPELSKKRISRDLQSGKDRSNVPDHVIDKQMELYSNTLDNIKYEDFINNSFIDTPKTIIEFNDLYKDYLESNGGKVELDLIIKGRDLIELGFEPGIKMGQILKELKEAQLNQEFSNKEEAIDWMKRNIKDSIILSAEDKAALDDITNINNTTDENNDITLKDIKDLPNKNCK